MKRLAPALVCALMLGLAACGGDGDGQSKEDFVAEADKICTEASERIQALGEPSTPDEIAETMPKLSEEFGGMLDELEKLEPPEDVAASFDALIAEGRKLETVTNQLGEAATSGDVEKLTALSGDLEAAGTKSKELGEEIGLERCGTST